MIKEYISKIQRGECSKAEVALTGICLILSGIVLGMKIAPFRVSTFGSFNGNTKFVMPYITQLQKMSETDSKMIDNIEGKSG